MTRPLTTLEAVTQVLAEIEESQRQGLPRSPSANTTRPWICLDLATNVVVGIGRSEIEARIRAAKLANDQGWHDYFAQYSIVYAPGHFVGAQFDPRTIAI